MNKKIALKLSASIAILIVTFVSVVGLAYAVFSSNDSSSLTGAAGTIDGVLHEEFPDSDAFGADVTEKIVWIENKGNKRAYVRVAFETAIEWLDESVSPATWKPAAIPAEQVQYTVNAPLWIDGKDGYWYYSKVLLPGEDTTKIYIQDVKLTGDIDSFYQDKDLRFVFDVKMELSQATHEAYKQNFQISDLPAGVERL